MRGSLEERFWAKVDKTEGCWLWTAGLNYEGGYGRFNVGGGRLQVAHRVAYALLIGPIPEGLELDHLCGVPTCVNPAHLEPVTHHQNVLRGEAGKHLRDKTHCPAGHLYDEANTYAHNGKRHCRICGRERTRRWRSERKP